MELWIRSQDREELLKAKRITFMHNTFNCETINYRLLADNVYIGSYATKERALEVLDEIQKRLVGSKKGLITTQTQKDIEFIPFENQVIIYEMPLN